MRALRQSVYMYVFMSYLYKRDTRNTYDFLLGMHSE